MRKILARSASMFAGNRNAKGLKRSRQLKIYKELNKAQWDSYEQSAGKQKEDLYDIIVHAIKTVPYYRDLGFLETDFHIETIYDDIKGFPVLTKQIIRREGKRMISETGHDWTYETKSGGTTGEPVPFVHSGRLFDFDQAGKILFDTWAGREIGDSQIRLWGSERDIISGKKDWLNKIYRGCKNEKFLNTFMMSDETMKSYIGEIKRSKPKMILAYVQSAREIAQFAEKNNLAPIPIGGMMTSAGTLDEDTYQLLTRVFCCPVLNRYGCREVGDIACSCDKNEGLHINMRTAYVEILDDDHKDCVAGEKGNIVVTSLIEQAMPLIRYDIGDYGAKTDRKCSCGRGWEMLESVNGRRVDIFKTSSGNKIDGEYFTHLFYKESEVKQFQVLQDSIEHILVKIVPYDEVSADSLERLKREICIVMGGGVDVEFDLVKDIPPSPSGKRAYTISLV